MDGHSVSPSIAQDAGAYKARSTALWQHIPIAIVAFSLCSSRGTSSLPREEATFIQPRSAILETETSAELRYCISLGRIFHCERIGSDPPLHYRVGTRFSSPKEELDPAMLVRSASSALARRCVVVVIYLFIYYYYYYYLLFLF